MAKGKFAEWLTEDGLMLLAAWARNGLTYDQIAKNMGVSLSTFKEWRVKYPAISAALKRTREMADIEVENAMHRHATGYTTTVKKPIKVRRVEYDDLGKKIREWEDVVTVEEEVHVPPDTTAGIFWLKNRDPDNWREKREAPPPPPAQQPDDGFMAAMQSKAEEVNDRVADEPKNIDDTPVD